jgi:peptide-methionine (S)-S-oxide reductase
MGGTLPDPSYEDVCTGRTGHAEVVNLKYDPARISYEKLLEIFFNSHDPSTLNRQGPDVGAQYRSVIFFYDDTQKQAAEKMKASLGKDKRFSHPPVTEIVPAGPFYRAEEYHQRYLQKHKNASCH